MATFSTNWHSDIVLITRESTDETESIQDVGWVLVIFIRLVPFPIACSATAHDIVAMML